MSIKKKQTVVWFRFKFEDTAAGRMQVQRAADKLFRLACVSERRTYTEEEVVRMVKAAIRQARCRGQLTFSRADLNAAMQDGATIEVTNINSDTTPPRVKITWPESTGYLYDIPRKEDAE